MRLDGESPTNVDGIQLHGGVVELSGGGFHTIVGVPGAMSELRRQLEDERALVDAAEDKIYRLRARLRSSSRSKCAMKERFINAINNPRATRRMLVVASRNIDSAAWKKISA